jgi:hypothetical protein
MNRTDPWCVYLTAQMHDKYGFSKDVAHQMVCRWLKTIESVRTPRSRETENPKASRQVRAQNKMASARV